ncbi:alpha/beta hydrolase [Epibacterium sp. SM1979]|uniref:Alpha/beta hydrolase n=1 Tax=Tritonibacter litoralis TaxID=2662264 RepID=A0A843Y900_9RHOB|nr:alpha/beta hydrolase [Tritonibacter litoralis]MQQ07491.1 alpha/beta hydrolase [Tritonibacter litoralis]
MAVVIGFGAASCSKAPDLVGVDNLETPALSVPAVDRQSIFIMTTREASEAEGVFYGPDRAPELGFASVEVTIPPTHVSGEIERPKRLPPDPRKEFAVVSPMVYEDSRIFASRVDAALAKKPAGQRQLLFFVHGYNTSMSDAILRLAQFVEDTDFQGVPVLFSWASANQISRYVYDINSALVARPKLLEASRILRTTNAEGVNVFAHSMGTFLTMEAIVHAKLNGLYDSNVRPRGIILASPDIDLNLFQAQLSYLDEADKDIYLMISKDDKALRISQRVSGGVNRVGNADASDLAGLGVDVLDLSAVDDSAAGTHSKFAGSPEIVQLIGNGLQNGQFNQQAHTPSLYEILDGVPIVRVFTP